MDVPFEMLSVNEWTQHLLCAERYGDNRVFLAGDAAHLVIPTGGLGMNTGIGDATDLAWKLAGTLHGWGGPALLASYELERRQVGLRNVAAAGAAMSGRLGWRAAWRPDIREPSGDATRIEICRRFDTEQRKITEISGIECGYRYVGSPVIAPAQQLLRWHRRSPLSRVEPGKAPAQLGQYIAHQPAYLAQRMPGLEHATQAIHKKTAHPDPGTYRASRSPHRLNGRRESCTHDCREGVFQHTASATQGSSPSARHERQVSSMKRGTCGQYSDPHLRGMRKHTGTHPMHSRRQWPSWRPRPGRP